MFQDYIIILVIFYMIKNPYTIYVINIFQEFPHFSHTLQLDNIALVPKEI